VFEDGKEGIDQQHTRRVRQRSGRRTRPSVGPAHPHQLDIDDLVHWGLPPDDYGRQRLLTIYLGGPIAGHAYDGASDWRHETARRLSETAPHVRCLDPMRGKEELKGATSIKAGEGGGVYGPKTTVSRDLWDVAHCDIVLINLLDASEVSVGSMVELGHAAALKKFVVVILPPKGEGSPHHHPFVLESASAVVHSLEDALSLLEAA
jgi:nucleoside 2-deoxyribosyltransferase